MKPNDNADAAITESVSDDAQNPPPVSESEADSATAGEPEVDLEAITKAIREREEAAAGLEPEKVEAKDGEKADAAKDPKEDAEPKEPKEPKDAQPKESAYARQLRKREKALVEQKQRFSQTVSEIEQRAAAVRSELAQRVAETVERDEIAARDPIEYLAKYHGYTQEDLARRILNDGKPSAEERDRRIIGRVDSLEKQIRERDEQIRQQTEQLARLRAEEAQSQGDREFITTARAAHPELKAFKSDASLLRAAYEVASEVRATAQRRGVPVPRFTNAEIADYLAQTKRAEYNELRSVLDANGNGASRAAAGHTATKATEQGTGPQGNAAKATAGPTLTRRASAERATVPKATIDMDADEERKMLIEVAEKATLGA